MCYVCPPLSKEVGRNVFNSQAEEILDLGREDDKGDSGCESDYDRIGDEFYDVTDFGNPHKYKEYTCKYGSNDQSLHSIL